MVTGAIAGVFLADFWLLRRAHLDVEALYTDLKSVNWRALVAVAAGVGPCLPGFVDSLAAANGSISGPGLRDLYAAGSWVVALILSGTVYSLLMLTAATSKSSSQDEDSSGSQISSEED
ncbi:unnamed protein product [Polarella glacialis]|uniref:Uncharacterized protein n=1 Tax=Polarella glacialis TaxID=89957 RepID=A0A813LWC8_POLGL